MENIQPYPKSSKKEILSAVLSYQLEQIEEAFLKYGISPMHNKIVGRVLNQENIIVIELKKVKSKEDGGKNKIKTSSIMSDEAYTYKTMNKLMNEIYNRHFNEILSAVCYDRKLLSEILEIEETNDLNDLFQAYVKLYGGLFDTQEEKQKKSKRLEKRLKKICKERGMIFDVTSSQ